jgi:hypothetical protein
MLATIGGLPANCYGSETKGEGKPTPKNSAAEKSATDNSVPAAETGDGKGQDSKESVRGIELGKFSLRTHRAVPTQMNRVSFTLYATVKGVEAKHFQQLLEHRENKIREQVIVATRLVQVEEYDDPEFTKIRRRILLRLRRTLPELEIEDIYVSDFELVVENG